MRFIGASCSANARKGDLRGSLLDNELLIQLTERLSDSGRISQWSTVSNLRIALNQVWRMVITHRLDLSLIDEIERIVRSVKLPDIYRGMKQQFAIDRHIVESIKNLRDVGLDRNLPEPLSKAMDELYQSPGVKQAFEARFVHYYVELFQTLPANHQEWPAIHDAIKKVDHAISHDPSLDSAMARVLGVGSPMIPLILGMIQTQCRMLLEASAALKQYALTAMVPVSLPFDGQESIDPFWGKRLHYELQRGGFAISSDGRDFGQDNPFGLKQGLTLRIRTRWEPRGVGPTY